MTSAKVFQLENIFLPFSFFPVRILIIWNLTYCPFLLPSWKTEACFSESKQWIFSLLVLPLGTNVGSNLGIAFWAQWWHFIFFLTCYNLSGNKFRHHLEIFSIMWVHKTLSSWCLYLINMFLLHWYLYNS